MSKCDFTNLEFFNFSTRTWPRQTVPSHSKILNTGTGEPLDKNVYNYLLKWCISNFYQMPGMVVFVLL